MKTNLIKYNEQNEKSAALVEAMKSATSVQQFNSLKAKAQRAIYAASKFSALAVVEGN